MVVGALEGVVGGVVDGDGMDAVGMTAAATTTLTHMAHPPHTSAVLHSPPPASCPCPSHPMPKCTANP